MEAAAQCLLRLPDDATGGRILESIGSQVAFSNLSAKQVTSLLRPLARVKRSSLLRKTLRSLEAAGLQSNVVHRNLLLSSLERLSHWQQAVDELRDLQEAELEATAVTMSTVSSSCAKASQWQKALDVFRDTRFKDTICFNVAISACARGDRWITALRLLREMRSSNVQVDEISYNSAISAVDWQTGLALLTEMKEMRLQADVVSYGAVLGSIQWDAACQLLQCMRDDVVLPDLVTVNAAIASCSLAGRWIESLHLLTELEAADAISVGSTVMACQKSAQWEVALAILGFATDGSIKHSIKLSVTACNAALSTCEKASQWEVALALLTEMEDSEDSEDSGSDTISYNAVIGACDKGLQWQWALTMLRRMVDRQLQCDRVSFYTAIHACESCGTWTLAQKLLAEMLDLGVEDFLGADKLNQRDYLHAFQAGDPIDCFKHVVLLSFWQRLVAKGSDPLTFVDAHAGAGVYDLLQGAATFHRNHQDGIQHLHAVGNDYSCTTVVMRYLQILRSFNRMRPQDGELKQELQFYLGSSGLLKQWLRPQDKAFCFEASESVMRHLRQHLAGHGVRLLCTDSYRWLLENMEQEQLFGRGLVLLDPPYDSVNSYHVWNLFMMKHLRQNWPHMSVALWYPVIEESQTQNFHRRLVELNEDVLVAEIFVERPHEQQQSRAGMALVAAPEELQLVLESELSALAQMLASSPYQRNVTWKVFWLREKEGDYHAIVTKVMIDTKNALMCNMTIDHF